MKNFYKHKLVLSILMLIFFLISIYIYKNVPLTQSQRLNKQCQGFGKNFMERYQQFFDINSKKSFFYSSRLDTCILADVDELGNRYSLYDIKRNYLKSGPGDFTISGNVFYCDREGVDNVVLKKAEKHKGVVFNRPFSEYLDNGEGDQPRALKAPPSPYTRERCKELFDKKLREIK